MNPVTASPCPVDLDRIRMISDGDTEFERELFHLYISDTRQRLNIIPHYLAAGDAKNVRAAAHTIKGASSNVGAEAVRSHAAQLESDASQGILASASGHLDGIREGIEAVEAFLVENGYGRA